MNQVASTTNNNKTSRGITSGHDFLATLTPEKIREMAWQALNDSLLSCYENRLTQPRHDRDREEEIISDCLSDILENIDAGGEPPLKTQEQANHLLREQGIATMPTSDNERNQRLKSLPYLKLCDQLQRADAACFEAILAGPCWDGSLRKSSGWTASMAEGFIRQQQIHHHHQQPYIVPAVNSNGDTGFNLGNVTIKEAVDKLIELRREGWKKKTTTQDYINRFQTFVRAVNGDKLTCKQFTLTQLFIWVLWLALKFGIIADFFIDVQGNNWGSLIDAKAPAYDNPNSDLPAFASWSVEQGISHMLKIWGMVVIIQRKG